MTATVSFIVPVYNKEQYISKCLDSLENQTNPNIEILCVDNNSTDNSPAIIKQHMQNDDRVRLIKEPVQGVSNARNTGIKESSAEYIAFVDADDFVDLDLAKISFSLAKSSNADIVLYGYDAYHEKSNSYHAVQMRELRNPPVHPFEIGAELFTYCTPSVCTKLFKKSFLTANNIHFSSDIQYGEDSLFSFSALMHASSINQYSGKALYHYRKEVPNSATQTRSATDGSKQIFEVLKRLDRNASMLDETGSIHVAILNQSLRDVHYAFSLASNFEQCSEIYTLFCDPWRLELIRVGKSSIFDKELYARYVEPSSFSEILFNFWKTEHKNSLHYKNEVGKLHKKIKKVEKSRAYKATRFLTNLLRKQKLSK